METGEGVPKPLATAFIAFLFVDGLFAFPFQIPFTSYTAAITMGLAAFVMSRQKETLAFGMSQALTFFLWLGLVVLGTTEAYSRYLAFRFPYSYEPIALACCLHPSLWRECLRQAQIEIHLEDYEAAEITVEGRVETAPE